MHAKRDSIRINNNDNKSMLVSNKNRLNQNENLELKTILETPVNHLNLKIKGSIFDLCIEDLKEELDDHGIRVRPRFYLSDGYGTCEGTINIGLAFWDINHLLRTIGERYLAEKYSLRDIQMVLRHEVGHAFCYSYKLYRLKQFRNIFRVKGHFFNTYPLGEKYKINPRSRDFVNPCGDHYAQKHPDDDFAETFATILDPKSDWRKTYRGQKGAFLKLNFVEFLMQELGKKPVLVKNNPKLIYGPVEELSMTVREFFAAKRAQRN